MLWRTAARAPRANVPCCVLCALSIALVWACTWVLELLQCRAVSCVGLLFVVRHASLCLFFAHAHSGYGCPCCGETYDLFGGDGKACQTMADSLAIPFLGKVASSPFLFFPCSSIFLLSFFFPFLLSFFLSFSLFFSFSFFFSFFLFLFFSVLLFSFFLPSFLLLFRPSFSFFLFYSCSSFFLPRLCAIDCGSPDSHRRGNRVEWGNWMQPEPWSGHRPRLWRSLRQAMRVGQRGC